MSLKADKYTKASWGGGGDEEGNQAADSNQECSEEWLISAGIGLQSERVGSLQSSQ